MAMGKLLEAEDIHKSFPGVKALNGVHFNLKSGEVHVLLGENGAGKSTLIKLLSGALTPDSGRIKLRGNEVSIGNPKGAINLGICTIYQDPSLSRNLTIAENIFLGNESLLVGLPFLDKNKMNDLASNFLEIVGLKYPPTTVVARLSSAERQLVAIARALSVNPAICIFDEPTASLTSNEIENLFAIIDRLKKRGVGIIYISHRLEEVKIIGDRITVLRDGNYVATLQASEASIDDLILLMVGREIKNKYPKENTAIGQPLLTVENLNKKGVFENISLTIRSGEILGMAGLVGARRTDIAKCIIGASTPDSGKVFVGDSEVVLSSPSKAINNGIAFLPADRRHEGLIPRLCLRKNVTLSSLYQPHLACFGFLRLKREKNVATSFANRLDVRPPQIDRQVQYFSGGNQQKIVLAKSLCSEAKVFIFDEPTSGIDVGSRVEIYKIISDLANKGAGILMISSDLPEVLGLSDRIVVICSGRITGEFERDEATAELVLECAFGRTRAASLQTGGQSI